MIRWGNPRWQRMLTWALRLKSPSTMAIDCETMTLRFRVPTLREAWTGWIR